MKLIRIGWMAGLGMSLGAFAAGAGITTHPLTQAASRQTAAAGAGRIVRINLHAPTRPFPHYWERMFGSGRAILALRQSYRRDLTAVHRATGFGYIRFHGIFDRGVGLYHLAPDGRPIYNWTYVDQIYDGLLKRGVRPYVELSFMPRQLAANPTRQGFWYHPFIAPPKSYRQWGSLIRHFARHLVERYGLAEVSRWYFEVWNEPNIGFWAGVPKQASYFRLYDAAARAIKSVSPELRVGGPATAQAAWVGRFIAHCVRHQVPVDFVSTHVYGNDTPKVIGATHPVSRQVLVALAVAKVYREVKASARPDLPIIFSEYNASYSNEVSVTDSPFMGPWLANTIRLCAGKTKIMSYWAFSDVFEEQGVKHTPFYGGFGLMAEGHIPKAAFNAFRLLHELGTRRLPVASDAALATLDADGNAAIAVWNYAPARGGGAPRRFELRFPGLQHARRAYIQVLDATHGNALAAWRAMGSPAFPTRAQTRSLRRAARLGVPRLAGVAPEHPSLKLSLPPYGLALIRLRNGRARR